MNIFNIAQERLEPKKNSKKIFFKKESGINMAYFASYIRSLIDLLPAKFWSLLSRERNLIAGEKGFWFEVGPIILSCLIWGEIFLKSHIPEFYLSHLWLHWSLWIFFIIVFLRTLHDFWIDRSEFGICRWICKSLKFIQCGTSMAS